MPRKILPPPTNVVVLPDGVYKPAAPDKPAADTKPAKADLPAKAQGAAPLPEIADEAADEAAAEPAAPARRAASPADTAAAAAEFAPVLPARLAIPIPIHDELYDEGTPPPPPSLSAPPQSTRNATPPAGLPLPQVQGPEALSDVVVVFSHAPRGAESATVGGVRFGADGIRVGRSFFARGAAFLSGPRRAATVGPTPPAAGAASATVAGGRFGDDGGGGGSIRSRSFFARSATFLSRDSGGAAGAGARAWRTRAVAAKAAAEGPGEARKKSMESGAYLDKTGEFKDVLDLLDSAEVKTFKKLRWGGAEVPVFYGLLKVRREGGRGEGRECSAGCSR